MPTPRFLPPLAIGLAVVACWRTATVLFDSSRDETGASAINQPQPDLRTPLLRTDFSDDEVWAEIEAAAKKMDIALAMGMELMFQMNPGSRPKDGEAGEDLSLIRVDSDRRYENKTVEQLMDLGLAPKNSAAFFVADSITMTHPDHPVVVVDLVTQPGRVFRAVPSQISTIDGNLDSGNLLWEELVADLDSEGIYR